MDSQHEKQFCAECGKELPEGASFCPFCGNEVKREKKSAKNILLILVMCALWVFIILFIKNSMQENRIVTSAVNYVTQENYDSLQAGMSYDEVCSIFGKDGTGHYSMDVSVGEYDCTYDYYYWYAPDGSFALVGFNDDEMVTGMAYNLK